MHSSMGRGAGLALGLVALFVAASHATTAAPPSPAAGLVVEQAGVALPSIGDVERGNRHYRAGRYAEAVAAYQSALESGEDSPVLRYNLGTALLQLGRYDEAEQHLRGALEVVEPEMREWVYYNLGQRYLEDARQQQDAEASTTLYDAAVEAYRQALRLQPEDVDAKWNYELALRERDEQEQQGGGGGDSQDEGEQDREQEEQQGDQGQGSESQGSPSQAPQGGSGEQQAPMTQEQADRILSAIEQDERDLFRDKLRKGRQEAPTSRDW